MEIPKIHNLSAAVIDQIAAGEVVERPAQLVKELIENSIDAGATEIKIEFEDGGKKVAVSDNGVGIRAEDLSKALSRYATSKIAASDDLWKLRTFGFRGEALASIAAISHFRLSSKTQNSSQGMAIESHFGELGQAFPLGHEKGTVVQVERLFENVPARLKFLKTDGAESVQIKNVIKALALAHPQISFRSLYQQELFAYWPGVKTRLERVQQILELKDIYSGSSEIDGVQVESYFVDPHHSAKTAKNIWIFAQNRWVQDRALQSAVMDAYRNLMMHGEYPIAVVWVSTSPEAIDVNVHPTKSQVKFAKPSSAYRAVYHSIRDVLEKAPWSQVAPKYEVQQELTEQQSFVAEPQLQRNFYQTKSFVSPQASASEPVLSMSSASVTSLGQWGKVQVLGQALMTYIIGQDESGIVFVDQHAAHERVLFEKITQAWSCSGGVKKGFEIQEFLFPLVIDLLPDQIEAVLSQVHEIEKLGIQLESMGPQSVGVKSAPSFLRESALVKAISQLATELVDNGGSKALDKVIADVAATMACHSAIRAGQALSVEEMKHLLQEMDEYPMSSFCPHGRNVSVRYVQEEMEKDFGRIV